MRAVRHHGRIPTYYLYLLIYLLFTALSFHRCFIRFMPSVLQYGYGLLNYTRQGDTTIQYV